MCVRTLIGLVLVPIALGCGAARNAGPPDASVAPISAEPQRAPANSTAETELVQSLERVVARLVDADEFSGVVLVSRQGQPLVADHTRTSGRVTLDPATKQVHRGRADERGHEQVHGPVVDLLWRTGLLEAALAHDGDT